MKSVSPRVGEPALQLVHPLPSEAAEKGSVFHDVYERIKDDIFEFRMSPGQRYSEQSLASALGVSRTPLRLALHVLSREGYLVRLEGHSSWQVKSLDLDYYEDLYDFRTDIEELAIKRVCRQEPSPLLAELAAVWCVPRSIGDFKQVAEADEHFHRTIVTLAGNAEMLRTFNSLTERIRIIRRLDFISQIRIDTTFEEHAKILKALMAGRGDRAASLMRAHISTSRTEIRHITLHRLAEAASRGAAVGTR